MIMFCHTCWNLLSCCTCGDVAPVHPDERAAPALWTPAPDLDTACADVVREAEAITRQAASR